MTFKVKHGLEVNGELIIDSSGNVDGRDVATDGTKLDGIEAGATADQTKADIDALNIDADTLDGQHASSFASSSHTHTFDSLTSKTSGTGDYSTNGDLVSGRGSGGVALTINDGYGNANVTFNHQNGTPEQNGNAGRIEVNTDSSTNANMSIELKSGVTDGIAEGLLKAANFSDTDQTLYYANSEKFATTNSGVDVIGNIVVSGTVDGRDVASDGSKLDGIESGATADQTAAEILAAIKTVDGAGSGLDADTLDGVQGSSFLRKDGASYSATFTGDMNTLTGFRLLRSQGATNAAFGSHHNVVTLPNTSATQYDVQLAFETDGAPEFKFRSSAAGVWSAWTQAFHDGYHPNADKLTTARTVSISGDVSGSASFDGSANVDIVATIADDSHNHTIANVDGLQSALDGKVDDGQVLTNVPAGAVFTDTTYSVGNGGLTEINFTSADNTKLDGIEAGANVTDAANVTPLVDAHLNKSSAGVDQVLSWNGADYFWTDVSGGSGGDADTLDGIDSSRFPYALTGSLGTTNTFVTDGGIGSDNITRTMFFRDNNNQFGGIGFHAAHATNSNYAWQFASTSYSDPSKIQSRVKNNGTWSSPVEVWTSGNDGSGSGLDADKLDGLHASSFLQGNQTITLSGDLSGSGTTSINAQIAANVVNANELNVSGNGTAGQALTSDGDGSFSWADAGGGGATGGGTDKVFYENDQAVTTDYTITDGQNAMSAGPITINSGVTVTVGTGEVWTVV